MTEKDFLANLEEMINASPGSLDINDDIKNIDGFDSMTFIGIILYASNAGVTIGLEELSTTQTLKDIFRLINNE